MRPDAQSAGVPIRELPNVWRWKSARCFESRWLPYALIAAADHRHHRVLLPARGAGAIQSLLIQDAFGGSLQFVGLDNFRDLFNDALYLASFKVTAVFSVLVAGLGLSMSLMLAVFADRVIRGAGVYKTLLIWPYAVAPAIAARPVAVPVQSDARHRRALADAARASTGTTCSTATRR